MSSSRAASTLASHARQVGRHAAAGPLDERALTLATTDTDRADATAGLVADAVASGDAERAVALLPAARTAAAADGGWRSRTRLAWVSAELALLRGQVAVADADEAVTTARAARAARHLTKSLLIRGVARHVADDPAAAADLLAALEQARAQQLTSLVWPAAAVAAEVLPQRAPELLAAAAAAAAAITTGLGPHGRAFADRPDVAHLLRHGGRR